MFRMTGKGRSQVVAAMLRVQLSKMAGRLRRYCRSANVDGAWAHACEHAVFTEHIFEHRFIVHQAGEDDIRLRRSLPRRASDRRLGPGKALRFLGAAVVDSEAMPRSLNALSNARADAAKA